MTKILGGDSDLNLSANSFHSEEIDTHYII